MRLDVNSPDEAQAVVREAIGLVRGEIGSRERGGSAINEIVERRLGELSDYISETVKPANKLSLDELLEAWSVHAPGMWDNDQGPEGWYAVSSDEAGGIVAYFADETSALRYRLAEINRTLNG